MLCERLQKRPRRGARKDDSNRSNPNVVCPHAPAGEWCHSRALLPGEEQRQGDSRTHLGRKQEQPRHTGQADISGSRAGMYDRGATTDRNGVHHEEDEQGRANPRRQQQRDVVPLPARPPSRGVELERNPAPLRLGQRLLLPLHLLDDTPELAQEPRGRPAVLLQQHDVRRLAAREARLQSSRVVRVLLAHPLVRPVVGVLGSVHLPARASWHGRVPLRQHGHPGPSEGLSVAASCVAPLRGLRHVYQQRRARDLLSALLSGRPPQARGRAPRSLSAAVHDGRDDLQDVVALPAFDGHHADGELILVLQRRPLGPRKVGGVSAAPAAQHAHSARGR
mmetsp:Transcript_118535/g.369195  ORF Transcript_118535/g.369195 Transcript_118535/m.369195 type:complete len:336 (+) Transcript_118535:458-1465(+)